MKFAIVETVTGRIVQNCECPDVAEAQAICGVGQHSLEVAQTVQNHTHYIDNGAPVAFVPAPTPHHTFDWPTKQWLDPRTLQDHKDTKWKSIKASREAAIDAPLVTAFGVFDSRAADRNNITDAVLMLQTLAALGTPTTIDFTLADNSTVLLTTAQMVTVGLLLGQKVQSAHARARAKRLAIDAASTLIQLEGITWNS